MGGRPAPDPDLVQAAHELSRAGTSNAEIGEILGVTEAAIRRWLKRPAPSPSSAPPPAHMPPPAAVSVAPLASDPIELVRQLICEQHAAIQADRQSGNMRGAASNAATLERLVKSLKQLEQANTADADVLKVSRADVARVREDLRGRVTAICNRPLLCSECARALSVRWGTGATVADPAP